MNSSIWKETTFALFCIIKNLHFIYETEYFIFQLSGLQRDFKRCHSFKYYNIHTKPQSTHRTFSNGISLNSFSTKKNIHNFTILIPNRIHTHYQPKISLNINHNRKTTHPIIAWTSKATHTEHKHAPKTKLKQKPNHYWKRFAKFRVDASFRSYKLAAGKPRGLRTVPCYLRAVFLPLSSLFRAPETGFCSRLISFANLLMSGRAQSKAPRSFWNIIAWLLWNFAVSSRDLFLCRARFRRLGREKRNSISGGNAFETLSSFESLRLIIKFCEWSRISDRKRCIILLEVVKLFERLLNPNISLMIKLLLFSHSFVFKVRPRSLYFFI